MRKSVLAWLVFFALTSDAPPALAHGFGRRYDLPVPLWLYLGSAAAAVALSFVAMGWFVRGGAGLHAYPRLNLLRFRIGSLLAHPYAVTALRLLSVSVFALTVLAGFLGTSNPEYNFAPTMIWIIWWVGLAYVCALAGNLWALLNPWRVLFAWAEALWARLCRGDPLSMELPLPAWVGAWPAAALFLWFAWAEIVWPGNDQPANLAFAVSVYSLITWGGMLLFGREAWLRHGEAFSVAFGLLARFAPTEIRVANREVCRGCHSPDCRRGEGECVNCYACFARAEAKDREWNLRPPAVGLLMNEPVHPSVVVFVILMLSAVTFDGFTETAAWREIVAVLFFSFVPLLPRWPGIDQVLLSSIGTLGLVSFWVLFLGVFRLFSDLMASFSGTGASPRRLARLFVFSLVPIAIGYHLAHYFSFLLIQGQLIIPLASDPFGLGWNLLGTASYRVDIGVVGVRSVWYASIAAIVAGHILAVYLSHVMALHAFEERNAALRSQYPMLALMVGYTMVSLWILAQPIVAG